MRISGFYLNGSLQYCVMWLSTKQTSFLKVSIHKPRSEIEDFGETVLIFYNNLVITGFYNDRILLMPVP